MRLVPGMYGTEFGPLDGLFGLSCGQMRVSTHRLAVHNGGWYNHLGEKIGWGDLVVEDLVRIADGLEPDEMFIVLPESTSFWHFVEDDPGPTGSDAQTNEAEASPGVLFVVHNARWTMMNGQIYWVHDVPEHLALDVYPGVAYQALSRQDLLAYIHRLTVGVY